MKKYRGNVEIIKIILDAAREEKVQNRIMHFTNLNQVQLRKYSDALAECGYLEKKESSGNIRYQTTPEGLKILEKLEEATIIVKEVKERLK